MCGIAGLLHQDGVPVDDGVLARMTDVLAHRGPDGRGLYIDGPVGLGHRRLSIIDLTGGAQPMASADRALWITYNGEIYNYRELRRDLIARGFTFETASDTEVILRAYEAWGEACLTRLRGMFAFAIWDGRRRRVLLARDRAGIKPMVYAWDGRCLRFASEIKAILQDPAVPRELSWDAVRDYFTYLYIPGPGTIFRAIRKLPPASYLVCSLDGGEPEVHRYWDLQFSPATNVSEAEWIEGLSQHLAESVRLHMVSDVPIGAFLSGGLDSSTVVAFMAGASSASIRTFSVGFDEADFDELAYARQVAGRYATDHFEMVVKPNVIDILPRLAWQFDEPFADASAVPTYCVSKITREHVTVALSGDGGDESFAGYHRYAQALGLDRQATAFPLSILRPLVEVTARHMPHDVRGRGYLELLAMDPVARYYRLMTFQQDATLARLLTDDVTSQIGRLGDVERFRELAAAAGAVGHLSRLQYLDIRHYLPEDILTKVDRTSMLVSLEARVPLLDHVLMEYVATIPESLKFHRGAGKYILRQTMGSRLPVDVVNRRKMGFGVPLGAWFRGELRDFAHDLLTDQRTRERGITRPNTLDNLLQTHAAGRRDLSAQIWSLICFELWCRIWWGR